MPLFLTLRDVEGTAYVTAMVPPGGRIGPGSTVIVVGERNEDPYPRHGAAIEALGRHLGCPLERDRCYPYRR